MHDATADDEHMPDSMRPLYSLECVEYTTNRVEHAS